MLGARTPSRIVVRPMIAALPAALVASPCSCRSRKAPAGSAEVGHDDLSLEHGVRRELVIRRRAIAVGAAVCFLLSSCSGKPQRSAKTSGPSTSPSPSATACASPAQNVPTPMCGLVTNVGTKDLISEGATIHLELQLSFPQFSPTFVKLSPGATVTLKLVNLDGPTDFQHSHTFTIDSLGINVVLQAKETRTITFTVPTNGQAIRFYCQPHALAGMQGAFYFH